MKKYKYIRPIAQGSFGEVSLQQNTLNGELVAIKTMKQQFVSWEECLKLRELKALQKLKDHVNIIKLKEIIQVEDKLNFVFEYAETNIYDYYNEQKKTGKPLSHDKIKSMVYQISSSLKYMHQHGFFHRDLKPENILIQESLGVIKLIDFGLAREIRSRPPFTDYVSTLWYRAPELLLRSTVYNSPVDVFALGLIIAELYEQKPLCQGTSDLDQLQKYCGILGTPTKEDWADGFILANQKGFNFRSFTTLPIEELLSNTPYEAQQLIQECLRWDPSKRPTITKLMSHPYFKDIEKVLPELDGKFMDTKQNQFQQQQQQQVLETKKSINLDDLDDILSKVDSSHKKESEQNKTNIKNQPANYNSNTQQINNITKASSDNKPSNQLYDFNNVTSQSYQQTQQQKTLSQQNQQQQNYQGSQYDRSNRPVSLQLNNQLGFNQQQQQIPKHHQKSSTITNHHEIGDADELLKDILSDDKSNNKDNNMYNF